MKSYPVVRGLLFVLFVLSKERVSRQKITEPESEKSSHQADDLFLAVRAVRALHMQLLRSTSTALSRMNCHDALERRGTILLYFSRVVRCITIEYYYNIVVII